MIEATSCGGVVIFRGKILLLYKSYKNKYVRVRTLLRRTGLLSMLVLLALLR